MLLVHGDHDELIPPQALFAVTQGLAALGVPGEWHSSAGSEEVRMCPWQKPFQPSVQQHRNCRLFRSNYLHESWLDYLYRDIKLDP